MRLIICLLSALALAGCFASKSKRVEARDNLTAAQYLVDDMGVADRVRALIPTIAAMVEQQIVALWPECASESKEVRGIVEKAVEPTITELTKNLTQSYAHRFSLPELLAIDAYESGPKDEAAEAAFKANPIGAKYFAQRRSIGDEVRDATQRWTKRSSLRLLDDMKAELRKRGHAI
jgi:hypothetical protein